MQAIFASQWFAINLRCTTDDVVAGLSNEWAYSAQQSSEQEYTFIRGAVNSKKRQQSEHAAVTHMDIKPSHKGEANVGPHHWKAQQQKAAALTLLGPFSKIRLSNSKEIALCTKTPLTEVNGRLA